MKKYIVSLLAILALCVSLCVMAPDADAATVASGDCGENLTWTLNDQGTLTISGTGAMPDWDYDGSPWYPIRWSIKKVVISDSVTYIGLQAFYDCINLSSVTIPDSVINIGGRAFENTAWYANQPYGLVYAGKVAYQYKGTCPASYTIRTGTLGIADYAFAECTNLTAVTIPDSVISIGYAVFSGCPDLTAIWVDSNNPNYSNDARGVLFDKNKTVLIQAPGGLSGAYTIPNSVTSIDDFAFYNCTGLTSVTIPNGVTTIGQFAFYECTGLTSVTIPDSVINIGGNAFENTAWYADQPYGLVYAGKVAYQYKGTCPASYTIRKGTLGIADYAFTGCTNLTSVTIPDSVISIGYEVFSGCPDLTAIWVDSNNPNYSNDARGVLFNKNKTVLIQVPGGLSGAYTIPNSVTSIGDSAFANCTNLTSVTIPDSVTSIDYGAFYNCTGLTAVTIPNSVKTIGESAFYECTGLTSVIIPDSVTVISDSAFAWCERLVSVTIGSGVTTIDSYAFNNCPCLTAVKIPDSVTAIGNYAFTDCSDLTSVTIPDSVTSMGIGVFSDCRELIEIWVDSNNPNFSNDSLGVLFDKNKTILIQAPGKLSGSYTIPDSVTTIGDSAFSECNSLTSATIPDSVTAIGDSAFFGCSSLTSLTIPDSVTTIGNGAFLQCRSLTSVNIPDSVTVMGNYAFRDCTRLTSVMLPDGVTTIGDMTFAHCGSLTSVTIPDSVTTIGRATFQHCRSLTSVTIPDSVTTIGDMAFAHCAGLTSVTIPDSVTTIGKSAFHQCDGLTSVTIPDSVTTIGHAAFVNCNGMKEILFEGAAPFIETYIFQETATTTAYYPANDPSWTEEVRQACGGNITWVPYGKPEVEKFDIDVARMILGNALEFQFGVAKTKIPDTTGYYALIEKTWADGTTTEKTIPATEWGTAGQYWAVVYDGLAAKEMGDTFYVTIYNADGVAVSNAKQDAVRDYVERAFASQKEAGKTMMVDMLNYGAAAQVYTNYGTDDLANNKLTDAQKAYGTAETPEMINGLVKGTNYNGTRFILESRIQVQLAFKNLTSDMYAIYTYVSAKGEAKTVRVEGEDFVVIGGKPAGVELSQLVYADARTMVEVTVYNADGTVHGTATDSIESCCFRSGGGDLFIALMKFADSAKAYL